MSVTFNEEKKIFRLDTEKSTYVMGVSPEGFLGHIYYGDTDITELGEEQLSEFRKKQLGFIFQEYNLLDTLTLEERNPHSLISFPWSIQPEESEITGKAA